MTWEFTLAGLLVGVLVGMTGMGGGSLMTPILILIFGFNAKVAVGTDILHGAAFKSFGAARHRMLGTVHARLACWMFLGSIPLSLVGVELSNTIGDNSMGQLQRIVGTDMLHAALLLWVAGAGHLLHGNVDLHAMAWLLVGSIPGVLLSSRFTVRLPDVVLRVALGTVLCLSGVKLLNVPEAKWILLGGLIALAAGLCTYGVVAWRARPRLVQTASG